MNLNLFHEALYRGSPVPVTDTGRVLQPVGLQGLSLDPPEHTHEMMHSRWSEPLSRLSDPAPIR